MLEKSLAEVWPPLFHQQRASDFLSQIIAIIRDEIGHVAVCGVPPSLRDDIECRGIRG